MTTYSLCYDCANYLGKASDRYIICEKKRLSYMCFASTDMDTDRMLLVCPYYIKEKKDD